MNEPVVHYDQYEDPKYGWLHFDLQLEVLLGLDEGKHNWQELIPEIFFDIVDFLI